MTKPKRLIGREIALQRVLKTEQFNVPEWEAEIILRPLSAAEAGEFTSLGKAQNVGTDPKASVRLAAWVIVRCWVDDAGDPVLTSDDIDALLSRNLHNTIDDISKRVLQISGLAPDAAASAAKNSASSQSKDSGTRSPLPSAAAP